MDKAVKLVQNGPGRRWDAEQKLMVLQEWAGAGVDRTLQPGGAAQRPGHQYSSNSSVSSINSAVISVPSVSH
jgi:hypothetical protein